MKEEKKLKRCACGGIIEHGFMCMNIIVGGEYCSKLTYYSQQIEVEDNREDKDDKANDTLICDAGITEYTKR